MTCLGSPLRPAGWFLVFFPLFLISVASTAQITSAITNLSFGSAQVGASVTLPLTVTDKGPNPLSICKATFSGTGFRLVAPALPFILGSKNSATLTLAFAPQSTGTFTGSVRVIARATWGGANHYSAVTVTLTGVGTSPPGTLSVTPGSLSFGTVPVGATTTQSSNLTASGGSVTVASASSSNSQFSVSGVTLPLSIASGQSVPFSVTFAPTASGAASANLAFFTVSSTSAQATASGTGATVQHVVNLSWEASSSTSIAGYNVFRSATHGGPYSQVNGSLDASMNFSDNTVQSGQTYYYVTTAVESNGEQSTYSNEVPAAVPFP